MRNGNSEGSRRANLKRSWPIVASLLLATGIIAADRTAPIWMGSPTPEALYAPVLRARIALADLRATMTLIANGQEVPFDQLSAERDALNRQLKVIQAAPRIQGDLLRSAEGDELRNGVLRISSLTVGKLQEKPSPMVARELLAQLNDAAQSLSRLTTLASAWEADERRQLLDSRSHYLAALIAAMVVVAGTAITGILVARREQQQARARLDALLSKESAVKSKQLFLGMVSHELRSPLQTLLSSIELLKITETSPESTAAMDRIDRAANLLNRQLRDLLTLARGEAGKLDLRPEPFEVRDFMRALALPHDVAAREKGLSFSLELPANPIFVVADCDRIEQVLSNLLENAIKYTRVGHIAVVLKPPAEGADKLAISIENTGKDIPTELVPELFKPFQRFANLEKSDDGAGVGLAVVSVVLMHLGGEINVDTQPGKGTRFQVSIPVLFEDEDAPFGAPQGNQILIVDDRQDILDSLAALGGRLGYTCDTARSAAEAANFLASKRYDAALIDLEMPVKRGIELAKDVRRSDWPNKEIPLIAISAGEAAAEGRAWPFNQFLAKPIAIQRLEAALGRPASVLK